MQPQVPGALLDNQLQHISVARVLSANVSIGQIATFDSAGNPATFNQDNGNGVMLRVGTAANPYGLANYWAGNNVNTTITHNLGRIPIGYYVTKKTATCDVFDGTVAADYSTITLQCTAGTTADTVIYIF